MTTAAPVPTGDTRRRNVAIVAAAAVTALALVFFMISSVTGAAWTDTTRNDDNSWATGTVTLTDDDGGIAMFTATDMVPGDEVDNSITVTNESTVPLDVKLYAENLDDADLLAQHLNLQIGTTDGGSDVYDGTLVGFDTAHFDYESGTAVIDLGTDLGVDDSQTYYFWVQLDDGTPDSFQDAGAAIDFVWEGQTQ